MEDEIDDEDIIQDDKIVYSAHDYSNKSVSSVCMGYQKGGLKVECPHFNCNVPIDFIKGVNRRCNTMSENSIKTMKNTNIAALGRVAKETGQEFCRDCLPIPVCNGTDSYACISTGSDKALYSKGLCVQCYNLWEIAVGIRHRKFFRNEKEDEDIDSIVYYQGHSIESISTCIDKHLGVKIIPREIDALFDKECKIILGLKDDMMQDASQAVER